VIGRWFLLTRVEKVKEERFWFFCFYTKEITEMYLARSIVFYSIIPCIVFFQKFKNPAQKKINTTRRSMT
jgi:hypothetical protein